jgi:hypothetical protein
LHAHNGQESFMYLYLVWHLEKLTFHEVEHWMLIFMKTIIESILFWNKRYYLFRHHLWVMMWCTSLAPHI